jgi:hypothetical protein
MSQRPNHRRGEDRHQDNGPTWEGGPPNSGCNSTHVARSRKKWKRIANRTERRTGETSKNYRGQHRVRPESEDES